MTRLIDADYLLKELEDWQADLDDAISGRQLGVTDAIVIACQIPTVDAVPVRHGKWENSRPDAPMFGFYYCSLCGRKRTSPQDRYCPNCGARMEEE